MSRGEHNERDIDKNPWRLKIPEFDPQNDIHLELSNLAASAEQIAADVELDLSKSFQTSRRLIRDAVASSSAGRRIDEIVNEMLGSE